MRPNASRAGTVGNGGVRGIRVEATVRDAYRTARGVHRKCDNDRTPGGNATRGHGYAQARARSCAGVLSDTDRRADAKRAAHTKAEKGCEAKKQCRGKPGSQELDKNAWKRGTLRSGRVVDAEWLIPIRLAGSRTRIYFPPYPTIIKLECHKSQGGKAGFKPVSQTATQQSYPAMIKLK